MLMKATRAHSWTGQYWKVIHIPFMEAMAIAGYAIGANQGYIYVRAEYPISRKETEYRHRAGSRIWSVWVTISSEPVSTFDLGSPSRRGRIRMRRRNGSDEFHRRSREANRVLVLRSLLSKGIFGKPSMLNNVETYANIPVRSYSTARNGSRFYGYGKVKGYQGIRCRR